MLGHQDLDKIQKTQIKYTNKETTYEYHDAVDVQDFVNKDLRTKEEIKRDLTRTENTLKEYEKDDKITFEKQREAERQNFKNLSMRLYADHLGWRCLWKSDSDEMDKLKKNLIYLNNLLDKQGSAFKDAKGNNIDIPELQRKITKAFDEVLDACKEYAVLKKQKGEGKHKYGKKRLMLVERIYKSCVNEKQKFIALADALRTDSFELVEKDDVKNLTLNELTTKHMVAEALDTEYQNEGNSTDVYKIKVHENGKDVFYYIKENLPLISEDVDGFVERRLAQLEASYAARKAKDGNEEDRLVKANTTDEEYDVAINFFRAIKTRLDNAAPRDKAEVRQKVLGFLDKDFDTMFTNLKAYNIAADKWNASIKTDEKKEDSKKKKSKKAAPRIEEPEIEEPKTGDEALKGVVAEFLKSAQNNQTGEKKVPMNKMTALDWIMKEMGLDKKKDSDIINVFKKQSDKTVERLFTISAGKEVELYGQIKYRLGEGKVDNSAANNTATCELAKIMGFTDVVTTSDTRVVKFKDRTGKVRIAYCTVCEAAEGDEFINVMKEAERDKKAIQYTPEAMRQLMRLQAFDTVCLQTDRHGRNFKCEVDRTKEGKLIITKIKSYDHDMSFGEEDLKKDIIKGEKNAFLPSLVTKAKKGSPLYKYVMKHYLKNVGQSWINKIKPVKVHASYRTEEAAADLISKYKNIFTMLPWTARYKQDFYDDLDGYTGFVKGNIVRRQLKDKDGKRIDLKNGRPIDTADDMKIDYLDKYLEANGDPELADLRQKKVLEKEEAKDVWKTATKTIRELGDIIFIFEKDKPYTWKDRNGKVHNSKRNVEDLRKDLTTLSKEQKKTVINCIKKLVELNEEYDFRFIKFNVADCSEGFFDLFMQFITTVYAELFKMSTDNEIRELLSEDSEETKKALKTIMDENGDIEIPSLLHFDYDAYQEIKDVAEGKKDTFINPKMKSVDFSNEKIDAIRNRCKDTINYLDTAMQKAQAFYKLAGWKEGTPQGTFLLKKDDYSKINDLSEMSVNPGQTYLSVDNESFLFGEKEFYELNSGADIDEMIEKTKNVRHDPKRWNDPKYLNGNDRYVNRKKFAVNALSGKVYNEKKPKGAA